MIPNAVLFTCEKCGKKQQTDLRGDQSFFHFFNRLAIHPNGTCKKCLGEVWTISLIFAERSSDPDFSLLGLLLIPFAG
ncbi:hypothetical protein LOC69_24205 [Blastopirellula sp. JC733]|nr:hypothetical protein [Blastopirellula sediminis]